MSMQSPNGRDRPPPSKGSSLIVIAILGAVGLSAVLMCGCGVGVWMIGFAGLAARNVVLEKSDQQIQQEAERSWKDEEQKAKSEVYRGKAFLVYWLRLVHMKNLDEPYRNTSKTFQGGMSRAQFAEFLDAHPDFKAREPQFSFQIDGMISSPRYAYQMHSGKRNYNIWVVKDGAEWKLDEIRPQ